MTHSMATPGDPTTRPGWLGAARPPSADMLLYHLSFPLLKVSCFDRPMDTERGLGHHYFHPGYWEKFLVSRVISGQLALIRWKHGGSAIWIFVNAKWVKKYRFSTIFSTRHSIIYKTMEKIHCIEHQATLMVPEISKQIQFWDTLYPRPQSHHNHHFKIQFN